MLLSSFLRVQRVTCLTSTNRITTLPCMTTRGLYFLLTQRMGSFASWLDGL